MNLATIASQTTPGRGPAARRTALIAGILSLSLAAVAGADEARSLADQVRYRSTSAEAAATAAKLEALTPEERAADLADSWGVEVTSIRLTANKHMIDYRFRVLDADKAASLFTRQIKPQLVHEKTGRVLVVPDTAKVGPLRNSNAPQAGKIYWMFFGNAGDLVQQGDKVTVVIGDFVLSDLVVE